MEHELSSLQATSWFNFIALVFIHVEMLAETFWFLLFHISFAFHLHIPHHIPWKWAIEMENFMAQWKTQYYDDVKMHLLHTVVSIHKVLTTSFIRYWCEFCFVWRVKNELMLWNRLHCLKYLFRLCWINDAYWMRIKFIQTQLFPILNGCFWLVCAMKAMPSVLKLIQLCLLWKMVLPVNIFENRSHNNLMHFNCAIVVRN